MSSPSGEKGGAIRGVEFRLPSRLSAADSWSAGRSMRIRMWVTSSLRRSNRALSANLSRASGGSIGDSLVVSVDALLKPRSRTSESPTPGLDALPLSTGAFENQAEWREPGELQGRRGRRGRGFGRRASTLAQTRDGSARGRGGVLGLVVHRRRSESSILRGSAGEWWTKDALRRPKPKSLNGNSTGEGLSPRRHTPISAPRSETRSRP